MPKESLGDLPREEALAEIERLEGREVNWVEPNIEKERGEIERTAREEKVEELEIRDAIARGTLEELTEDLWSTLENTESYDHVRPGNIEDAIALAERPSHDRDWRDILKGIREGRAMLVPIILVKKDGIPTLISGNTRLMISRALRITPKAFIVHLEKSDQ